jgi:4-aminobutyrate aminotransferase-like enzyme
VPSRSTIMDTNSFRAEHATALAPTTRAMTARRAALLGASYRLFYRDPVHVIRGQGAYLWDAEGNRYLDMYNNVPAVGHAHPTVIEAVTRQMEQVNTHTRYLHEGVLDYAEDLLATLPEAIDQVMFLCTGSEANDLAVRVARAATGGAGIILTSEAYHGNTDLTSAHSPALGSAQPLDPAARLVAPPDAYRARWHQHPSVGEWFAGQVDRAIDDMEAAGVRVAGLMIDSIFSSDGVFADDPGMLAPAVDVVHRRGGLVIADEVQPGFGRTGDAFWGFARHGIVPDIVTMGKPMGNGMPISALAARSDVLDAFSTKIPYFNTFGGNPVSIAAAAAVLETLRTEDLQERARVVGGMLRDELRTAFADSDVVGDIRGAGQFTAVELVASRESAEPAGELALDVVEGLRHRGVLTSVAGPRGNILKLRPPLAFDSSDVAWAIEALVASVDDALSR